MNVISALVQRFVRDAVNRLTVTETTLVEFWSSTMLLWLGAMFLDSGETLIANVPFHAHLMALMPEHQWGILLGSVGLLQSFANAMHAEYARKFTAITTAGLFFILAFLAHATEPVSPFFAVFGTSGLVMSVAYISLSLAHERRVMAPACLERRHGLA
jgi:hypothetical protein